MESELNIPSTVNDPHYRYKMPRIQTTIQGSGNGIKTNWVNLPDVSNALKVPVEYPIKFISRELGANTDIKPNSYLINGSHSAEDMQKLLDKFIKKYVLCPKCHLPEIHGKIKVGKKDIKSTCRSCGSTCKLDSAHDFAAYIKRNPPPYEEDDKVAGEKVAPEKEKEKEKKKKETKIDKELKKNIKECCLGLPDKIKDEEPIEKNIDEIKQFLAKYDFSLDLKFYCFTFGIIPTEIYTKSFEHRLPIIKHFIEKESDNNPDEALYNFLIGFQDLIFSRQKGKNKIYVPSVLYYLYDRDILSEDFWKDYLNGVVQKKYQSILNSTDGEKQLKESAKDFSDWIETGPYEGDEEEKKDKEKEKEEKENEKEKEKEKEKAEDEEENKKGKGKEKKKKNKKKKKAEEKEKEKEKEKLKQKEKKEEKEEKEEKEDKKEEKEDKKEDKKEEKEEKKEDKKEEEEIDIDGI